MEPSALLWVLKGLVRGLVMDEFKKNAGQLFKSYVRKNTALASKRRIEDAELRQIHGSVFFGREQTRDFFRLLPPTAAGPAAAPTATGWGATKQRREGLLRSNVRTKATRQRCITGWWAALGWSGGGPLLVA